jgi:hypothetical protein
MSTFTVVEEQGVAVVSIDQPGSPVILTAAVKAVRVAPRAAPRG